MTPGRYRIELDTDTGRIGYLIGYCEKCAYKQVMNYQDCYLMIQGVADQTTEAIKALAKLQPKVPIKERFKEWAIEKLTK